MQATLSRLIARYEADAAASGSGGEPLLAERRLTAALEAIGWRAASDTPASEVAAMVAMILSAWVHGQRDIAVLENDIAECLWQNADHLDGSAAARSEWAPAAVALLEHYADGQGPAAE